MSKGNKAFTAVVTATGHAIGLAERDVPGYTPVQVEGEFERYDQAKERADELNRQLGLDRKEAWFIVASSMGAQNRREKR